jgi:deoxycytidylate deaminase
MREAMRLRNECSTDFLNPTGAVVVKNGSIVGRAANQSALKNEWLINFHKDHFCVRRFLKIKTGTKYWLCPGCASFRHHGESRAVKDAARQGHDLTGAELYLYGHWWCCKPCWDTMLASGITRVYLVDDAEKLFRR